MSKINEELQKKDKTYSNILSRKIINIDEYKEQLIDSFLQITFENINELNYEELLSFQNNLLNKENFSFPLRKITFSDSEIHEEDYIDSDFEIKKNKIIFNEKTRYQNFFKELKNELRTCNEFFFMISFIRMSGLQLILSELKELEDAGIKGKIITSTYLNITEPKALKKLMEFKNIKVKVYDSSRESFHTKAYLFKRNEKHMSTSIIGSSNLSHSALHSGNEWNIKTYDAPYLNIYKRAEEEFFKVWNSDKTDKLDNKLITLYMEFYKNKNKIQSFNFRDIEKKCNSIEANIMQKNILNNLIKIRAAGHKKAVVIAATGTGKTYLSAFDVRNFNPKKILFLAHREELLDNALNSYKKLLRNKNYGKLSMNSKDYDANYLFATVQSMSKLLEKNKIYFYKRDEFDYIIIDEFHHAAAESYKKILNYFNPKFLLGLTATPERADGKDILELCNFNIAGEVRLKQALEKELLVPFHYFGINDNVVDYDKLSIKNGKYIETELTKKLNMNKRVELIIEKIKLYDYDGDRLKALAFCINKEHAKFMSKEFNEKGYKAEYIIANHSQNQRQNILNKFSNGDIEIICCVDIFNEGVDIPELNMLLFLRPTDSATIFIQQLGRGLRKNKNKEYVTVLDFIGNHNKAFLIPVAFASNSGEMSNFDVRHLKKEIQNQFSDVSGTSYIELDRICQKRILSKLDSIKVNSSSNLKTAYENIRNNLGRSVEYFDFLTEKEIHIEQIINKYKSFLLFKKALTDNTALEKEILENSESFDFIQKLENMLPIKWFYHFYLIKFIFDNNSKFNLNQVLNYIKQEYPFISTNLTQHKSLLIKAIKELDIEYKLCDHKVSGNFYSLKFKNRYYNVKFNPRFKQFTLNLLDFAIKKYNLDYLDENENINKRLIKYKEYSRIELQYILESHAQKGSWRAGYSIAGNNISLFITMNKDKEIPQHLNYDNFFYKQEIIQWISQSKTSHNSPIGKLFINHKEENYFVHIFVRKYSNFNGNTMQFTYLGEADYYSSHGDKPIYLKWKLKNKIPDYLFLSFIE